MTGGDVLDFLAEGSGKTLIWRILVAGTLALALVAWGLLGFFAKDELEQTRTSIQTLAVSVSNHVQADVEGREANARELNVLDLRLTKIEQHKDDLNEQVSRARGERDTQIRTMADRLSTLEREVSLIEGRLATGASPR